MQWRASPHFSSVLTNSQVLLYGYQAMQARKSDWLKAFCHVTPMFVFFLSNPVIGYAIFRSSNAQKDRFRTDPHAPEFQSKLILYEVV